jgi:FAD/FMN-containing dehydrogenase
MIVCYKVATVSPIQSHSMTSSLTFTLAKYRGSISAEHGLGLTKGEYLHCSKTQPVIDVMRLFKNTLDPNGILNPYKVLPRQRQ